MLVLFVEMGVSRSTYPQDPEDADDLEDSKEPKA